MKIACPKSECRGQIGLTDRACGHCGFALTVGNVWRHYAAKAADKFLYLRCPNCNEPTPIKARECQRCGHELTVAATIEPSKQRWQNLVARPPPGFARRVQLAHLILSGLILLWLVSYIEARLSPEWFISVALSVLYLAVFVVCSRWVVPMSVRRALTEEPAPITRVALILNFFSGVLFLQILIANRMTQSLILAVVFIVVWIATYIFCNWFWPLILKGLAIWSGAQEGPSFDSRGPQGRSTWYD